MMKWPRDPKPQVRVRNEFSISHTRRRYLMRELQLVITAVLIGVANIAPAGAQGLLTAPRISAALANEAVGAAVASCAAQGYSETAVLVDGDGVVQAALRGDNAGIHTIDSAHDKAYTAVSFKNDTLALAERAKPDGPITPLAKLPHVMFFPGGVVIKLGEEVIGAIGASGAPGGNLDDGCAKAGVAKIRERLK